jgi:hypothetical protein
MLGSTSDNGEWIKGGINNDDMISGHLRKMTRITYGSGNYEHGYSHDSIEN